MQESWKRETEAMQGENLSSSCKLFDSSGTVDGLHLFINHDAQKLPLQKKNAVLFLMCYCECEAGATWSVTVTV